MKNRLTVWCWVLMGIAATGPVGMLARDPEPTAAKPVFQVLMADDHRRSGHLTGAQPRELQLIDGAGNHTDLGAIRRLELPVLPRTLPDQGWKSARLANGDRLHIRFVSQPAALPDLPRAPEAVEPAKAPAIAAPSLLDWTTGFSTSDCPWSRLAAVGHPDGTHCLVYSDFETSAEGWQNNAGHAVPISRDRGRSGGASLKCSMAVPSAAYNLSQPLVQGWLEFSFFHEPQADPGAACIAEIDWGSGPASVLKISLAGPERWYEVQGLAAELWSQQKVRRSPGWHTVRVAVDRQEFSASIDGLQLVKGRLPGSGPAGITAMRVTSSLLSDAVWLDDFAVSQYREVQHQPRLQSTADQLDMVSGDQLFGKVTAVDSHAVQFQVHARDMRLPWSDIAELQLAQKSLGLPSVEGWIADLDLQPWSAAAKVQGIDRLRGALLGVDEKACVLDHPVCGRMQIEWLAIRSISPAFRGREWVLEGSSRHLGNEVKSAFEVPVPEGTELKWKVDLSAIPEAGGHLELTAIDLEPAGAGTRPHPWLERLRSGVLTSELWVNDQRIATLNREVSGRGTARQPRLVRVSVPARSLVMGANEISIRLRPGNDALREYDDWELRDLRFGIKDFTER